MHTGRVRNCFTTVVRATRPYKSNGPEARSTLSWRSSETDSSRSGEAACATTTRSAAWIAAMEDQMSRLPASREATIVAAPTKDRRGGIRRRSRRCGGSSTAAHHRFPQPAQEQCHDRAWPAVRTHCFHSPKSGLGRHAKWPRLLFWYIGVPDLDDYRLIAEPVGARGTGGHRPVPLLLTDGRRQRATAGHFEGSVVVVLAHPC